MNIVLTPTMKYMLFIIELFTEYEIDVSLSSDMTTILLHAHQNQTGEHRYYVRGENNLTTVLELAKILRKNL